MSPILDTDQIILRLQQLKNHLKILRMLQKFSLNEINADPFKKGALLHYLQLSAEICIDVGQMIIAEENFEIPSDSAEIFIVLGQEKILNKKFAASFAPIARFRNLLVHEYTRIDMRRVHEYLQHELGQFETFARAIAIYMKAEAKRRLRK